MSVSWLLSRIIPGKTKTEWRACKHFGIGRWTGDDGCSSSSRLVVEEPVFMYLILNYSLDMKLGITGADLVTVWTWSLSCVLVWVCSRLLLKESIKELIVFCCFGSRRIYKSVIYLYLRRHSQIAFLLHSNFFFDFCVGVKALHVLLCTKRLWNQ